MGGLDGKSAIVTGAAGGLGAAVARRFAAEGARVCLADISERVHETAGEIDGAIAVTADVTDLAANRAVVDAAAKAFGGVDVLVCNAGIYDQAVALADVAAEDLTDAFHELFDVNVLGYLLGVRAALPALLAARGSVVLTVSYAGFHPAGGGALYTASKHAVVGLVRQLAYELAPHVRVNGVSPGVVPTRLRGLRALGQEPQESLLPGTEKALPMGVLPDADDYSGLYLLAAADEAARVMTGSILVADSGMDIRGIAQPAGGNGLLTAERI